jgi:nucleoside-diphosphate-sugar epimerase
MSDKCKILVIGGTSFFGKQLVEDLILEGHNLTIASRGNIKPFSNVNYIKIDRDDSKSLKELKDTSWDRVYDQICMNERHAEMMIDLFRHVGQYIHISTGSVYDGYSPGHVETEVDLKNYDLPPFDDSKVHPSEAYGENKRRAEAVYFQRLNFPFSAIRFCIVIGKDDTSKRLIYHVNKIKKGEEIYIPNLDAEMSLITQEDASSFLRLVGDTKSTGAYNITSGNLSIRSIMSCIEEVTNQKLIQASEMNEENSSPYGIEEHWCMNIEKSISIGFKPNLNLREYIKKIIS